MSLQCNVSQPTKSNPALQFKVLIGYEKRSLWGSERVCVFSAPGIRFGTGRKEQKQAAEMLRLVAYPCYCLSDGMEGGKRERSGWKEEGRRGGTERALRAADSLSVAIFLCQPLASNLCFHTLKASRSERLAKFFTSSPSLSAGLWLINNHRQGSKKTRKKTDEKLKCFFLNIHSKCKDRL